LYRNQNLEETNKITSTSERRRQFARGGKSRCEKHNFNSSNKKVCGTCV